MMSGRFLSKLDIHEARREQEIVNSMIKRGEIDTTKSVREQYVVCGCGVKGCGFITRWLKTHSDVVDLKEQQQLYQRWLEEHKQQS